METAGVVQVTNRRRVTPSTFLGSLQNLQERAFSLAMTGDVDLGILAEKLFCFIRHLGSAENNQDTRVPRFELFGNSKGDIDVPDVHAKRRNIRAL